MNNRSNIGVIVALMGAALITISFIDRNRFWIWFILGIIPYIVFFIGIYMKCPRCGRWWASREQSSELLDRWNESKDVDRWDETRNRNNEIVSRTRRIEQVIVHCEKKQFDYRCRYCDHEWKEIKIQKDR